MNFTHLVEINDPLNPLIEPLSRAQLWRGLLLRAESPDLFIPHLDAFEILEPSDTTLIRTLSYGLLVVRDLVTFSPLQELRYDVPPQGDIQRSSLSMAIEEPEPELFFVRFTYDDETVATEGSVDAYYNEFRRSAYHAADIDTIRVIRQLAEDGRL